MKKFKQVSIGRERAIELGNSNFWEDMPDRDLFLFQATTEELSMPFDVFHKAAQGALGRPVFTHEFANIESLIAEFLGDRKRPSFEDIINLIPEEKRILVLIEKDQADE